MQYENFLTALSTLTVGKLDDNFLEYAAHVIANNELLTHIERGEFHVDMQMGWVTSWNTNCGIAAHSQRIIDALPTRPTIFAPRANALIAVDGSNVIRCWDSKEGADLLELQQALASSPIDVVVIQYAESTFELSALAKLVTQQKELNRAVFVMLHSTAGLSTLTAETGMLDVRVALKLCDGIFVHAMNDVKNLEVFKVRKNVNLLPLTKPTTHFDRSAAGGEAELDANYLTRKIAFAVAKGG